MVKLDALPDGTDAFAGWGGACTGSGACSFVVDKPVAVNAKFETGGFELKIQKNGPNGVTGTVQSANSPINCGAICTTRVPSGTVVKLNVRQPDQQVAFLGWGGDCANAGRGECSITMDADKTIPADFSPYAVFDDKWTVPTGGVAFSGGNLSISGNTPGNKNVRTTVGKATGRWYWEIRAVGGQGPNANNGGLGVLEAAMVPSCGYIGGGTNCTGMSFGYGNGTYYMTWPGATLSTSGPLAAAVTNGNVYMFALDASGASKALYIGHNGVWYNGGDPVNGITPAVTGMPGTVYPGVTFYPNSPNAFVGNFGQSPFSHPVPKGYNPGLWY